VGVCANAASSGVGDALQVLKCQMHLIRNGTFDICRAEPVGAVYDRALFSEINEIGAVIDRAYKAESHFVYKAAFSSSRTISS
jgi:hypothetical protein